MIIVNFVGIRVEEKGKEPIDFCMALDNEERAVVAQNPALFDKVTSVKKLLARLLRPLGIRLPTMKKTKSPGT